MIRTVDFNSFELNTFVVKRIAYLYNEEQPTGA